MLLRAILIFVTVCLFFPAPHGTDLTWSFFRPSQVFNASSSNLQAYARQKLSALRHLRNKLSDHRNVEFHKDPTSTTGNPGINVTTTTTVSPKLQITLSPSVTRASKREEAFGSIFKNMDSIISFTTGPLKKMITSTEGIESLATMVMPKRDVLQKLLEIKGNLEPSLKRYLTDKYNGFLSSLIPYSENIGVPPFVLNSMKVPQDFDPRWQLIKSLLDSQGGIEKFLHTVVTGDFKFGKRPEVIESRMSGDETELISDQEPDASGKGYRKQQQFYLSSFKKRLMKPGGGKLRLMQQQSVLRPSTAALDYETMVDQNGQYGHVSYDTRAPDEMMSESYYAGDANGMGDMDLAMSASGHGGRGHGHGHGHGQASAYGGFLDPFTILGGLAFLTYLGLMLQNSLNRNNMNTTRLRSFHDDSILPVVPISLKSLPVRNLLSKKEGHQQRHGRSVTLPQNNKVMQIPVTVDQVLNDITKLWKEIEKLKEEMMRNDVDPNCIRYKQCKIVLQVREMNLQPVFGSKLTTRPDDLLLLNYVPRGGLRNLCVPYRSKNCE